MYISNPNAPDISYPYVNIDSTTPEGISRAKSLGFAESELADVVYSPLLFETNDLFTSNARGRLFSVFRHPVQRAISMFFYLRVAEWEPTYSPEMKNWTILDYAKSRKADHNWMTRKLSNQLGSTLLASDLEKAKEVLRTKFIVGLLSNIDQSMSRFERFFQWTYHDNPTNQEACRERLMNQGANSNKKNKEPVDESHPAWNMLALNNEFDME